MIRYGDTVGGMQGAGGYGGFGFGGGFGGGGTVLGVLIGALLPRLFGNFNNGNYEACRADIAEIQNQLGNVRADIGDVKYDSCKDLLTQTSALMMQMCNGQFQNAEQVWNLGNKLQCELFGLQKDILVGNNAINQNILTQGYQNQLANCQQTNTLQNAISECCCNTNLNIERMGHAIQLRDLECCCKTQQQFEEVKSLITNTAKEQELLRLRQESERGFIRDEIRRSTAAGVGATFDSWWAAKTFNGATYPQPPFFYSQPAV